MLANMCIAYRSPTMKNLSDLDFDLSRSLKVKFNSAIGIPIYGLLLMFNSNIALIVTWLLNKIQCISVQM